MRKMLFVLFVGLLSYAFWAGSVWAAPRATFDGGHITLTKTRCNLPEMMKRLLPEYKKMKWLSAKVVFQGENIKACYTMHEGKVKGFDEHGNTFVFNREDFQETTEI